ncbi:uncharacterized protein CLUP02_07454 [Colletotrichum lupini]|uniref:Uncharacterized protein n=1 Tax=Colletotrichum lupini TaxID=145971 RepID=A0A9Q8WFP4_9PEZI|nr:uncharacterized protein CLUP02_07454 [Colletotrichum lupini]UQC81968.1 hypothetical protein CLUP02_07454 [Colletotrichum lupini]
MTLALFASFFRFNGRQSSGDRLAAFIPITKKKYSRRAFHRKLYAILADQLRVKFEIIVITQSKANRAAPRDSAPNQNKVARNQRSSASPALHPRIMNFWVTTLWKSHISVVRTEEAHWHVAMMLEEAPLIHDGFTVATALSSAQPSRDLLPLITTSREDPSPRHMQRSTAPTAKACRPNDLRCVAPHSQKLPTFALPFKRESEETVPFERQNNHTVYYVGKQLNDACNSETHKLGDMNCGPLKKTYPAKFLMARSSEGMLPSCAPSSSGIKRQWDGAISKSTTRTRILLKTQILGGTIGRTAAVVDPSAGGFEVIEMRSYPLTMTLAIHPRGNDVLVNGVNPTRGSVSQQISRAGNEECRKHGHHHLPAELRPRHVDPGEFEMRLAGMCKQWLAGIRQQLEFGAVFDVAWVPKLCGVHFMQPKLVTLAKAKELIEMGGRTAIIPNAAYLFTPIFAFGATLGSHQPNRPQLQPHLSHMPPYVHTAPHAINEARCRNKWHSKVNKQPKTMH